MNALSVAEIERLRALVFQNSVELLEEADLLFQHKRFARAYTLAHLSSEELAKPLRLRGSE
ncbi:MAG: AbiV family abortive infection protein [Burkholderiales bacterium]